jgi:hypothetical protein
MRYVSVVVGLAASGLIAILAVSMLPQYWTYTSLVAIAVTVSWACLSAVRARRRLPARKDARPLNVSRTRRELERDAFGDAI